MGSFMYNNAKVTVNAVDLSTFVKSATVHYGSAVLDETAMGDGSENVLAGLLNWSVDVEWNQDQAASAVDVTLFPLVGAAPFALKVRPVNATITATNVEYQGNAILPDYTPIQGSVGDLAKASTKFKGTATLARATS